MAVDRDFEQTIYNHQQAAAPAGSLFETFADRTRRHATEVLHRTTGPFASIDERNMLTILLKHAGREEAAPAVYFVAMLRMTPREVKQLVQDLRRNFGVQIGASRSSEGGGYYLITNEQESRETTDQLINQAVSMLRTAHAMRGEQTVAELMGQISLALEGGGHV